MWEQSNKSHITNTCLLGMAVIQTHRQQQWAEYITHCDIKGIWDHIYKYHIKHLIVSSLSYSDMHKNKQIVLTHTSTCYKTIEGQVNILYTYMYRDTYTHITSTYNIHALKLKCRTQTQCRHTIISSYTSMQSLKYIILCLLSQSVSLLLWRDTHE